ncbi:FAD-dependent monooxygenase [Streptomyces roseochromogenus]|uniref:FAD-binding domain-containing protein n=1 Tax=Streptomyces roseochromogenus subsp. oscitans DS 12.976 TaxID=1352936 RepID=V6KQ63_STRRC|nr:FAD-dependent monooxygenase [Streptomyces roseochromogenus]EST34310.1 hypothetical protein M878_11190 [Streptomyces roseochromogenus subsp. oscitans DS 12.976]
MTHPSLGGDGAGPARAVACIGAGPAGLLAATQIKAARPGWRVEVFERQPRGVTFGYGVVFSDIAVRTIEYLAPTLGELLVKQTRWEDVEVRSHGGRHRIPGHGYVALSRHRLLGELVRRAEDVGVVVHHETPVALDELRDAYDLVIAADGARSRTRRALARELGASVTEGRSRFAWLGTGARFDAMTFIFEQTSTGVVVAHGYPHGDGISTFVVEVPEGTGAAEEVDLPHWEHVLAKHLDGHPLEARDSAWSRFPQVRLERCVHDNVVVIGDAAHTAHYSVGSGTRLALEDGFYLARMLTRYPDLSHALAEYQRRRLPSARELQTAGARSMRWFERAPLYLKRPAAQFSAHLLTRAAHVVAEDLKADVPALAGAAAAELAEAAGSAVSESAFDVPLNTGTLHLPGRRVTETGAAATDEGPSLVLSPSPSRPEAGSPPHLTVRLPGEDHPRLALYETGPCPETAEQAAEGTRRILEQSPHPATVPATGIRVRVGPGAQSRPRQAAAALQAQARALYEVGRCDLVDLAAEPGREPAPGESTAVLEIAGAVRAATGIPVMLSGFRAEPGQIETHLLAGRIDLWCEPEGEV